MTDTPFFHYIETNMNNLVGNTLYRQIVGIQMGTNSFYIEDKLGVFINDNILHINI